MLEAAGVDQVVFVQQAGNNQQAHIMESLELFGQHILPAFRQRDIVNAQRKQDMLRSYIKQALERVQRPQEADITAVDSYAVLARRRPSQQDTATRPKIIPGSGLEEVETALLGKRS